MVSWPWLSPLLPATSWASSSAARAAINERWLENGFEGRAGGPQAPGLLPQKLKLMGLLEQFQHFWERLARHRPEPGPFPEIFEYFRELLVDNQRAMELIADLGEKSGGEYIFDRKYLLDVTGELHNLLLHLVKGLNLIGENRYLDLYPALDRLLLPLEAELRGRLRLSGELPYGIPLVDLPLDCHDH